MLAVNLMKLAVQMLSFPVLGLNIALFVRANVTEDYNDACDLRTYLTSILR